MPPFKRAKKKVYEPQFVTLPKEAPIHRIFPFKGPNQVDWVDDTIFYDVFYKHDNSSIICIGPPLLNLEGVLELQEISCNGRCLSYRRKKFFHDHHNLLVIKVPRFLEVEISRNHPPVRENGWKSPVTLVTIQKDNPLGWIKDWISWHNCLHGVGRLILYDNGSREYGHDELVDALQEEEGDFQSVLVNWNFPFTWDGWDGSRSTWYPWPQRAALNHCYLKYGDCGYLLNLDVDEYLVAEDGTSLRDYLRQTPQHYLPFRKRYMFTIGPEKPLAERSFRDSLYYLLEPKATLESQLLGWFRKYPYWKYACQCNMNLWLDNHWVDYQGIRQSISRRKLRFQHKLYGIFYSIIKYVGLTELLSEIINNNNSPRETFWVYHFTPLNIASGRPGREWREPYRDKAHFEIMAKGKEIVYDAVMIKQAEKYGL